jgi:hypothetical protein
MPKPKFVGYFHYYNRASDSKPVFFLPGKRAYGGIMVIFWQLNREAKKVESGEES